MQIIPAIDILRGQVVRLHQGRYEDATVYHDDPLVPARRFEADGATRLHVVDLDGAREGRAVNVAAVERILGETRLSVQVGGGIRDRAAADRWLGAGASVVLGTAAVRAPELVRALAGEAADRVVVAIDARGGEVAVQGWLEGSGRQALDVAQEMVGAGVRHLLFTNIDRDGTRQGPDVEATAALQRACEPATVIASGGIGDLSHLIALADAGVRASVVGRALYDGAFDYGQAVRAVSGESGG